MHRLKIKARFGELDPYNHLNHSVYVAWFEAARCEALEEIGMGLHVLAERGIQIVVTDLAVKYRRPAVAGVTYLLKTAIVELGAATSVWQQELVTDSEDLELMCTANLRAGICNSLGRPTRCPPDLRDALQAGLGT